MKKNSPQKRKTQKRLKRPDFTEKIIMGGTVPWKNERSSTSFVFLPQ